LNDPGWWPLTLVVYRGFESAEEQAQDATPLALRVVAPAVLEGGLGALTRADWAGAPEEMGCADAVELVLADPVDGCAGTLLHPERIVLGGAPRKRYAVAKRGACTFVDKVRALAPHAGRGVLRLPTRAEARVGGRPSRGLLRRAPRDLF